ncbi:MAG: helix-turn-helix domain-containing protein [Kiloniellales bacterium]|nr:helix-turn-helix domain-containing protein [Kiloniellales bacterium]
MRATDIPTDPQKRLAWAIYQLKLRGSSFAQIAREQGQDRSTIRRAMLIPSFPQEQAIAAKLGISVKHLFPERYDAAGRRLHWTHKDSTARRDSNVQKPKAA